MAQGISNLKVYDRIVYKGQDQAAKLLEGDYYERHFVIVRTRIGHPCAYIETKPDDWACTQELDDKWTEKYELFDVDVHGGATYYGNLSHWGDDDRTYLGWDYAHSGDYDCYSALYCDESDGHKWTLLEMLMDVAKAYDGIMRQNDDHWEETHAFPVERDGT